MSDPSSSPRSARPLFAVAVLGAALVAWLAAHFSGMSADDRALVKSAAFLGAAVLLLLWALSVPGWKRGYVLLVALMAAGLTLGVLKVDHLRGGLVPIFAARDWAQDALFGGTPDTLLEQHRQAQGKADGGSDLTEKPGDFPAYRGANRDGVVTGPAISRDWEKAPPKEIWRQPVGGGFAGFSVVNGYLVTIEQRRDNEVVVCYEAATGKEVWTSGWPARFPDRQGGDGPRATPAVAGGDVFAYGATGRLACLDGRDGREKWAVETLEGNANIKWGLCGSPLVYDDLVVVNPGAQADAAKGRALRAYDRSSGKEVWAAGDHPAGYASPQLGVLGGARQVLLFDGHGLAGHDPRTGAQLWRVPWKTDYGVNAAQPIVIGEDTVLVGSGYNHGGALFRVTQSGGKWTVGEVWRTRHTVMCWKHSSGVYQKHAKGDYAYGLNEGALECVDLKTGRAVWKDDRRPRAEEAFGHGQLLLYDDRILALTEFGELVLVEATPEAFRELGRVPALTKGPKTWNTPAVVHGRIYVRNEEQMACFDLTAK